MRLEGHDEVDVPDEKVRDYLLSPVHPVGRYKAAFFGSLGFSAERWSELRHAIVEQLAGLDVIAGKATAHGAKYETRGMLVGPNGRGARVVVVWLVRRGERKRRLVTMFPEKA
jgi:hypothetical protein